MTKNAKAVMPSNEELVALVISLKADKEAAEKRAAEAEAKAEAKAAKPASPVTITDKGQIAVTFPAGNSFITARYYAWHWDAILKFEKEIRAACKSEKAMTEAKFRASK